MNIKQVQKDKKKIRRDFNFNVKIMINSKKVTLDETVRYLLFCIKKTLRYAHGTVWFYRCIKKLYI